MLNEKGLTIKLAKMLNVKSVGEQSLPNYQLVWLTTTGNEKLTLWKEGGRKVLLDFISLYYNV